jgi:hypothetical protein
MERLVIRVNDAAGVPHYALPSLELPPGFTRVEPEVNLPVDSKDPFGLASKRGGAGGAEGDNAQQVGRPVVPASRKFLAALFSTGELMIQVGDDQVFLSRDHQVELRQYCARFEV